MQLCGSPPCTLPGNVHAHMHAAYTRKPTVSKSITTSSQSPLADTSSPTERNGRKTLTTVQGIPTKFDQKKILKVIKKKFACNGTIVNDEKMGEVIQLQGDQRKDVEKFLIDKDEGLDIDAKTIKVHGF